MKKIRLYTKFHQVMDYAFPILMLFIFLSTSLPLAAKLLLGTMVLLSLLVAVKTYRASIDSHNLYLNNLFTKEIIGLSGIKQIEPAPFYYGATSGRVSEKGYRIIYEKNNREKKIVILVSRKKELQQIWEGLKSNVAKKNIQSGI